MNKNPYSSEPFAIELASSINNLKSIESNLNEQLKPFFNKVAESFGEYIEPSNSQVEDYLARELVVDDYLRSLIPSCRKLIEVVRKKEKNLRFLENSDISTGDQYKDVFIGHIKYSTCIVENISEEGLVSVTATRRGKAERFAFELDYQTLQFWTESQKK